MSEGVRLVVFDWGGVLLRIVRSFPEGIERAQLPMRGDAAAHEGAREKRAQVAGGYQRGQLSCDEFFDRLAEQTLGHYTPDELRRVHHAWLIEEYPGASALVEELHATPGVETALLSNTNAGHWTRHQPGPDGTAPDFPTAGTLNYHIASHLVGAAKPDEAIYRALEAQTGHSGDSIVFFDDLADNIAAARAIGWRAEQIDHTGDTAAQMRTHLQRLGVL